MRIFILTLGTRGDLELFLALARVLRGRGHQVVFGTSPFYERRVRDAQIEHAPIGSGSRDALIALLRSLPALDDKKQRVTSYYRQWVQPQLAESMARVKALIGDADYFINNLKSVWKRDGRIVPGANVTYEPPGSLENLAKYAPRLIKHNGSIVELVALNQALVDPEDAWGEPYHFTGFWGAAATAGWEAPEVLLDFLKSGPAPVIVTMGSMVMFDTDRLVRTITEALRMANQRGVIVGGWSGLSLDSVESERVCCVSEVPYEWLFAKSCCIIHHGGCGTIAAVLRAGKPSILLPMISSQENFAAICARENLVSGVFDIEHLTPEPLAASLRAAVDECLYLEQARRWQEIVSTDRGELAAAELIESHAREHGFSAQP